MIYSFTYAPLTDKPCEIKVPWNQLGTMIKNTKNRRINITNCNKDNIEAAIDQITKLTKVTANYTISCRNFPVMFQFIEKGFNAYFDFPVADWETFDNLCKADVTDIQIDGALGFCMDSLNKRRKKVLIRANPVYSSNAGINNNITSFYIRPEDLEQYNNTIDILDFQPIDASAEETYYNIYSRGEYNYDLSLLIKHLRESVPNYAILKTFAQTRLNCQQKCKIPGHSCHICERQFNLANKTVEALTKEK